MPPRHFFTGSNNEAPLFDRLLAAGSYLTLGTVGMLWFILNFLFLKKPMKPFLMCNLMQSFIISILFAILGLAYNIFIDIFVNLPFIGKLFFVFHKILFLNPVFAGMNLVNYLFLLFITYLSVIALFGKLAFVPYITDMTKKIL